jgi:hypothetical protein
MTLIEKLTALVGGSRKRRTIRKSVRHKVVHRGGFGSRCAALSPAPFSGGTNCTSHKKRKMSRGGCGLRPLGFATLPVQPFLAGGKSRKSRKSRKARKSRKVRKARKSRKVRKSRKSRKSHKGGMSSQLVPLTLLGAALLAGPKKGKKSYRKKRRGRRSMKR